MKRDVLSRYERNADGSILIDVSATRTEDLYSDFDRSAPQVRRELDQDLVVYLIDCARELGHEAFAIRFTLDDPPDDRKLSSIRRSVNGFFLYLAKAERQKAQRVNAPAFSRTLTTLHSSLGRSWVKIRRPQSFRPDRSQDVMPQFSLLSPLLSLLSPPSAWQLSWLPVPPGCAWSLPLPRW